jgi:hypothetical protein
LPAQEARWVRFLLADTQWRAQAAINNNDTKFEQAWTQLEVLTRDTKRDRKIALLIGNLPEGVWEIRYGLRAETPGNTTRCLCSVTRCTRRKFAATTRKRGFKWRSKSKSQEQGFPIKTAS